MDSASSTRTAATSSVSTTLPSVVAASSVAISVAQEADAPAIREFYRQLPAQDWSDRFHGVTVKDRDEQIAKLMNNPHVLAKVGDRVVGACDLGFAAPELKRPPEVAFVVHTDQHGKGVASGLLKTAETYAARRGETKVVAYTRKVNAVPVNRFLAKQEYACRSLGPEMDDDFEWTKSLQPPADGKVEKS